MTLYVKVLTSNSITLSSGDERDDESQFLAADGKSHVISSTLAASAAFRRIWKAGYVQLSSDAAGTNVLATLPDQTYQAPLRDSYRPLKSPTAAITSTITTTLQAGDVGIQWDQAAGKYRYVGTVPTQVTYPSPNPFLCVNNNNTQSQTVATPFLPITVEFWSNATDLRVLGYAFGRPDMWALVDDRPITDNTYQHANFDGDGSFTWKLTQTGAVYRKWRLSFTSSFYEITINSGATIVPTAPGFQLLVIGDSYVQGGISIANAVTSGTAGIICAGMPWGVFEQNTGIDVWRAAIYGTGYTAQSDFLTAGPYGSTTRMAAVAAMPDMDMVVMFGSINDHATNAPTLVAAANAAWSAAKVAQPNAPLIVVGMECFGGVDAGIDALNSALATAAMAHPDVEAYVDLRSRSFMSGTGKDGSPTGDGNCDVFLAADATHLTHQGCKHWGDNLTQLMGTIPVTRSRWGGDY